MGDKIPPNNGNEIFIFFFSPLLGFCPFLSMDHINRWIAPIFIFIILFPFLDYY